MRSELYNRLMTLHGDPDAQDKVNAAVTTTPLGLARIAVSTGRSIGDPLITMLLLRRIYRDTPRSYYTKKLFEAVDEGNKEEIVKLFERGYVTKRTTREWAEQKYDDSDEECNQTFDPMIEEAVRAQVTGLKKTRKTKGSQMYRKSQLMSMDYKEYKSEVGAAGSILRLVYYYWVDNGYSLDTIGSEGDVENYSFLVENYFFLKKLLNDFVMPVVNMLLVAIEHDEKSIEGLLKQTSSPPKDIIRNCKKNQEFRETTLVLILTIMQAYGVGHVKSTELGANRWNRGVSHLTDENLDKKTHPRAYAYNLLREGRLERAIEEVDRAISPNVAACTDRLSFNLC